MDSENKHLYFSWRAAILNSNLSPTTRHVLLTLGCHMNDMGESCYPSIELLTKETGLSRVSVIKHLGLAVDLGWITSNNHGYSGQGWRRHQYSIGLGPEGTEGGKAGLPPSQPDVGNVVSEGGKPNSEKVVNVVNLSTSKSTSESTSDNIKPRGFVPPLEEEVTAYMVEQELAEPRMDAKAFMDHHEARGWKFKTNLPMKDWKAAVRTWKRNQGRFGGGNGNGGFKNKDAERADYTRKNLEPFVQAHCEMDGNLFRKLPPAGGSDAP
jgi:hypothetical protein